jgi:hypothetical protein
MFQPSSNVDNDNDNDNDKDLIETPKAPSVLRYVAEFNGVVLIIMAIVYHFPALYVLGCGLACLRILPDYSNFTADYPSICVLLSLMHACFHDYFMEGMGICDNAFVDSHLHYAMLFCVFKLLPVDHQKWFTSSKVIGFTLRANFVNCVFGMCLPALVNWKETGILDLKYSHDCKGLNRLESWEYILYGVTSLPSTIAIACYFIAGTIVVCTNYSIHISKAIWIALGIFSCSTAAYFFVDPFWLVSFYNQIKYDQLYFVVPSFFLYLSPFKNGLVNINIPTNLKRSRSDFTTESTSDTPVKIENLSKSLLMSGRSLLPPSDNQFIPI